MLENVLFFIFASLTVLYSAWIVAILASGRTRYGRFMPPVSIIVPAHNEEKYIYKTLYSLVMESYPRKEIIVVDDGSTDRTSDIVRSFGKSVRLLRTSHKGKSAALNEGLRKSRHGIIITIDADSEIRKGSIREIVKPLADAKIGGVTGVIRARITANPLTWFQDYEYIMSSGWRYTCTSIRGNSILPGFAAFKKGAIRKIGGFSRDTLTEDFDIVMSLERSGYRTVTVRDASIITNVPQTFRGFIKQRLRWGSGTLQVIRKHSGFITSRKSGPIGYFTIPSQLYWYIHAFVYLPVILYLMLIVWSEFTVTSSGYLSFAFVQHLFTMFSIYGIFNLIMKIMLQEYALTGLMFLSLSMFFLSLVYSLIVFAKVARPSLHIVVVYAFFFPFSLFNLSILAASAVRTVVNPARRNKWS